MGWNTRDPLAAMNPLCAPILNNWFPKQGELITRGGSVVWATLNGAPSVVAFAPFSKQDGTSKLFACTAAGFFDVTASGVGVTVAQARTNGAESSVNFTNSAGNHFLLSVNGVDPYIAFDGAAWTNPATTGVTTTTLTQLFIFKRRLWAIQANSQSVWYLDIDSIAGTWVEFPIGALLKLGGYLVAGTNWTIDGGTGSDDNLLLISSEGEVLVYSGSSPTSATAFQLIGAFQIGKPLSKYCFQKIAGDVLIATDRGLTPASTLSTANDFNTGMLSDQIQPSWVGLASTRIGDPGWQMCVYAPQQALIVNMPDGDVGEPDQIAFNMNTKAPCSFTGWDAEAICVFNNVLYYGDSGGAVHTAWLDDTAADSGSDVVATCQQAYNYFGSLRGVLKHIELLRFQIAYTAGVQIEWLVAVDFQMPSRWSLVPRDLTFLPAIWDVSLWDVSFWEVVARRDRRWRAYLHPPGYAISIALRTTTKFAQIFWSGTDLQMTSGKGLG